MNRNILTLTVLIAICVVLLSSFFIVNEIESVIVLQFGRPMRTIMEADLYMKIPFIQEVKYFDRRILEWDGQANKIPTRDKKFIWVDTTARWKIKDPLLFYQSVRDELGAQKKLDDIIDGITRDVVSNTELIEVVRNSTRTLIYSDEFSTHAEKEQKFRREEKALPEGEGGSEAVLPPAPGLVEYKTVAKGRQIITEMILKRSRQDAAPLGIQIIDVLIKRINYTEDVQEKVFTRMISERKKVAEQFRSEGRGERARTLGIMERKIKEIRSGSYRQAQEIKGQADGKAAAIYAENYSKDPDFYTFLKTLQNYRETVDQKTFFLFTTQSEYLRYFKSSEFGRNP